MADEILQNTLPSLPSAYSLPELESYKNPKDYNEGIHRYAMKNQQNINKLKRYQVTPEQLKSFQSLMSLGTQKAYRERQQQELDNLSFDPTKVSGNTFSSIIKNLEEQRGAESSKIYSTHFNAYREIQAELNKRLEYLQDLQESKRQYMTSYKYGKKAAGDMLKGEDTRKSQLKSEKGDFNREFVLALQRAGSDTAYMNFAPYEIRQSIMELQSRGYGNSDIESALMQEGIPTFPGSIAANTLNLS